MTILHPEKIGIGGWDLRPNSTNEGDPMAPSPPGTLYPALRNIGFKWYYTWHPYQFVGDDGVMQYLCSFWNPNEETPENLALAKATNRLIIGFNEPYNSWNLISVSDALDAWPALMALGNRLATPSLYVGSPWLDQFMNGIASRGYRVDVMNYHFYGYDSGIFASNLAALHSTYGLPIIVTEWAKSGPGPDPAGTTLSERQSGIFGNPRYSFADQAAYAMECTQMMDGLSYVEKHAWFAATEGGGWYLNSGVVNPDGSRTPVGDAFFNILGGTGVIDVPPPPPPPSPTGPTLAAYMNAKNLIQDTDPGTVISPVSGTRPTYSTLLNALNINRRTGT